ncbi:MAG: FAD-binding oxidoreductase [Burkholderiaceae bacterium]
MSEPMPAADTLAPITGATPIRFSDTLPAEVDVVVIGGGVIGVFTALSAVRAGLSVALIEKGQVAGEQSSRNWGWLRQQGRDPDELPIMMDAVHLWKQADEQTGGKVGFVQGGMSYIASTPARLAELEQWLEVARQHNLDTRLLNKQQLNQLIDQPGQGAHQWLGAIHTPSDARAEPWQAVPAVADLAQAEGVRIVEDCAARALDSANGNVQAVLTERGRIRCSQVVIAAGAWSALFLRQHNIFIPQLTVRQSVAQTAPLPAVLQGNGVDESVAFRRRNDGGYTLAVGDSNEHFIGPDSFRHFKVFLPMIRENIRKTPLRLPVPAGYPDAWGTVRSWAADEESPFERMRVLNPSPNMKTVERMRQRFAARFPGLGVPTIRHAWAGMIDTMPDIVPIVDRVPGLANVILATGMSGHGMGIGPGFGQVIARMLQAQDPGHDLSRFRFGRFSDGTKAVPGPHV